MRIALPDLQGGCRSGSTFNPPDTTRSDPSFTTSPCPICKGDADRDLQGGMQISFFNVQLHTYIREIYKVGGGSPRPTIKILSDRLSPRRGAHPPHPGTNFFHFFELPKYTETVHFLNL